MQTITQIWVPLLAGSLLLAACNENGSNKTNPPIDTTQNRQVVQDTQQRADNIKKAPVINIIDTLATAKIVLCIKDSAASTERVAMKLAMIYGEKLGKCLADNKMTMAGPPIAWYKSQNPPFFFEAGVPVSKKPAKLPKNVYIKEIPACNVIIARFFGPYEMLGMAYESVADRLKTNKDTPLAPPYEVYIGDPVLQKDPYKVQTDVVFPVKAPVQQ